MITERVYKMKKIQVVGDSLLKGVIYDETISRHVLLKENGISMLIDAGFDIKNDAKFGLTIAKARKIIENSSLDMDEIIIEVGGNDCDYNWDDVSNNPNTIHQTKTPIDEFKDSLESLVQFILSHQIKPILVSIPPLDDQLFFNFITKNRQKENIMSFLGDTKMIYYHQRSYNEVIERVAKQYALTYIPLRETIEAVSNVKEIYCKDGMHLNERGQAIIYDTFKRYI